VETSGFHLPKFRQNLPRADFDVRAIDLNLPEAGSKVRTDDSHVGKIGWNLDDGFRQVGIPKLEIYGV
jgi:hypothetical protein